MPKLPFFSLLFLVIASSCTETEQTTTKNNPNTSPIEAKTNEEEAVDTIFLGVADEKQPETSENKDLKGSQIPGIIQQMYKKAEKAVSQAVSPAKSGENATDVATKPTYFFDETAIGKYFAQQIKPNEILTFTPSLLESVSIKGKEGTIVTFPPACLVDENGNPVTSEVQIELKEFYTLKDMIFANLTTTANDLLLETGGMVYLNATCKGKPLHLMATHPIIIEMPTQAKKEGMELFYGEKRPASGVMNWRVADTKNRKSLEKQEDMIKVRDWEKVGEGNKSYDIGEIELSIHLEDKTSIDGKPVVSFQIKNLNPKLKKYKDIITKTLNQVAWEKDQKSKASGKALYEYKQYCLLGNVIFANLDDLLAIREEIAKYKNFDFQKTIPLQAHLNKDLYQKKVGLMNNYVFDRENYEADSKFFEANFKRVVGEKNSVFDDMYQELQASNTALMNSYSAHYAISYLFTLNRMGWANCDRYEPNLSQNDLTVMYDNKNNTDIKLILSASRSLIPGRDLGKRMAFSAAPKGEKGVLFATKLIDNVPYFCLKEVLIGKDKNVEMTDFRQMTMAELEKEMIRLGIGT